MTGIIIITIVALVNLFLGLYKLQRVLVPFSLIGLTAAIASYVMSWNTQNYYFNQMMFIDNYAIAFSVLCIVITMMIIALSPGYFEKISTNVAEYISILLFALVGVLCMVGYNDLSMLFIGIEIMSVSMFIMAGIRKRDLMSNEAALKYFLMGAFATGFLLFGIALIYGFTGSFNLDSIRAVSAASNGVVAPLFVAGMLMMIVGLSFKVSAAPFHFWAPDVYDGSPSLVTAFMSSVVKTASFAAFLRLFLYALSASIVSVSATLWAITMLTIVVGNVIALYQQSFKRMLAYSSISHAGYMMMAILSLGVDSGNAIFIYATAYSIASVIAFAVLIKVKEIKNSESFEAFNGLGKTNPLLALSLTIAMCSFAGIPLTAGFFGKFFIFTTTLAQHYYWLVGIAIVNAVIGIWYYFRVIIAMYMKPAENNEPIVVSSNYKIILWLATILTLLFGIYPSLITSLF